MIIEQSFIDLSALSIGRYVKAVSYICPLVSQMKPQPSLETRQNVIILIRFRDK